MPVGREVLFESLVRVVLHTRLVVQVDRVRRRRVSLPAADPADFRRPCARRSRRDRRPGGYDRRECRAGRLEAPADERARAAYGCKAAIVVAAAAIASSGPTIGMGS